MMTVSLLFTQLFSASYLNWYLTLFLTADVDTTLGTSCKHLSRRVIADNHYRLNAQQMKDRYNSKRVHIFEEGDIVSLRIPRIDRAATDLHRLPCIVVQRVGKNTICINCSMSMAYSTNTFQVKN